MVDVMVGGALNIAADARVVNGSAIQQSYKNDIGIMITGISILDSTDTQACMQIV